MQPMELRGERTKVVLNADLSISVLGRDGEMMWRSSESSLPAVVVGRGGARHTVSLGGAATVSTSAFGDGAYRGHTIRLSGLDGTDAVVEVALGIDASVDELLVQVAQVGGRDNVVAVEHFYRFEKLVSRGGYLVVPRGSGYIIPADCADALPGEAGKEPTWIGGHWSLPMFGMVSEHASLCAIVDTWWDCQARVHHMPGDRSVVDFSWQASLGKLAYPRRLIMRLGKDMDYVAMAKVYRQYARRRGTLRTLEEKAEQTPAIRHYVKSVVYRWPGWNSQESPAVLEDIRRMRQMGLDVVFFYPKWSALGFDREAGDFGAKPDGDRSAEGGWQAYLLDDPVVGGWGTLVDLVDRVHELGALVQGMFVMRWHFKDAPDYSETRFARDEDGNIVGGSCLWHNEGAYDDVARLKSALDHSTARGLKFDAMYFDGYTAFSPLPEDFSAQHPMTRKQKFEMQNEVFAEVRRRGILPGGELRRFWAVCDCDWSFYTDWAGDRQGNVASTEITHPVGEPVPLCQLAFGDCCIAGFSGDACGPEYNWYPDRTPRLYELMYASQPCYNWLVPQTGFAPVPDWNDGTLKRRIKWLKTWSAFYQEVAMSQMVRHKFLCPDRRRQRVEFANGVVAEFDMTANAYRVEGMKGFTGDWESADSWP